MGGRVEHLDRARQLHVPSHICPTHLLVCILWNTLYNKLVNISVFLGSEHCSSKLIKPRREWGEARFIVSCKHRVKHLACNWHLKWGSLAGLNPQPWNVN